MDKEVEIIYSKLNKWNTRLQLYQESCAHLNVDKVTESNTGNYDPSQDSYWYNCKCLDCNKQWMEDQ